MNVYIAVHFATLIVLTRRLTDNQMVSNSTSLVSFSIPIPHAVPPFHADICAGCVLHLLTDVSGDDARPPSALCTTGGDSSRTTATVPLTPPRSVILYLHQYRPHPSLSRSVPLVFKNMMVLRVLVAISLVLWSFKMVSYFRSTKFSKTE